MSAGGMVDSKLSKNVSKSIGRAKEKILQNLGKVDRTADEIFDEHVTNFTKQQTSAARLQKELNNYIRCIRATATASHSLMESIADMYEPEWGGKELLCINAQNGEMLWNDFAHRLAENVLIPLNNYQSQFPNLCKKISKRNRKLVDFDSQRHNLQSLQSNPKRAESKLARQRETLESAKRTYEDLNLELHEELPGLYSSRVGILVGLMKELFGSEGGWHSEMKKVHSELESVVDILAKDASGKMVMLNYNKGSNRMENGGEIGADGSSGDKLTSNAKASSSEELAATVTSAASERIETSQQSNNSESATKLSNGNQAIKGTELNTCNDGGIISTNGANTTNTGEIEAIISEPQSANNNTSTLGTTNGKHQQENGHSEHETERHEVKTPTAAITPSPIPTTASSPTNVKEDEEPGVLYRVRSTYRYQKEDVDELSFEAGEVINVIQYDDPEEQEEGWLMGVKANGEKGMFPANFTRPI